MRTILLATTVLLVSCGCVLLFLEVGKLPEAVGAKAIEPEAYVIYLNVNAKGEVVLPPNAQGLNANGNAPRVLENLTHVEIHLKRIVKEDELRAGPAKKDAAVRLLILRVHEDCPFEKAYGILKAGRTVGFTKFQWRVIREDNGERRIPVSVKRADEKVTQFTARITADPQGKVEKITLRGEGIEKEIDFKADIDAFAKKLKEVAEKNKGKRLSLTLEVADKLLQGELIKLIDAATGAGIADVSPIPIDPRKR